MSASAALMVAAEGGIIGDGRTGANLALGVGLLGLAVGWLALVRAGGRIGIANARTGGKSAIAVGLTGTALAVLHLATSSGGPGTGNGLVGCARRWVRRLRGGGPGAAATVGTPAVRPPAPSVTGHGSHSGQSESLMTSTKSTRRKPGTKCARTSAFTVPNVVAGRCRNPSVNACRICRLKSGRGWAAVTSSI